MFRRIEKIILYLTVLALPFTFLPKNMQLMGLGQELSKWFILAGMVTVGIEYAVGRFHIDRRFLYFAAVYILWQLVSLALGLATYEYNELLTLNQMDKLPRLLDFLAGRGIAVNEMLAIKLWLFLRFAKDIIFNSAAFIYIGFIVFHLYSQNFRQGFYAVRRAVLALMVIMGAFSLIELAWFKLKMAWAENILRTLSPYYLKIADLHGWWPPLVNPDGIRSLCAEPSFFGILCAFAFPFLWSYVLERRHTVPMLLFIAYCNLLAAATNSRTAVAITAFELIALLVYAVMAKNKIYRMAAGMVLVATLLGCGLNLVNFESYATKIFSYQTAATKITTQYQAKSATDFVDKNINSLTNVKARSNKQRLGSFIAYFKVAVCHPVFGTGVGLHTAYVDKNIPEFSLESSEMQKWQKFVREQGVLKSGYPELNKFAAAAAQTGFMGLFIYLLPWLYVGRLVYKNRRAFFAVPLNAALLISLMGLMLSQMSNSIMLECSGIILALIMCWEKNKYV